MTNREQKLLPSARQLTSVRRTSNLNSLTGLPERLDFLRQVQQLLTEKKLNGWCVLSIDIEHFKLFNNWYGQVQGDELAAHNRASVGAACEGERLYRRVFWRR